MARAIAQAVHRHAELPPVARQLHAAGEALSVLEPISRAIHVCTSPETQMRLCDELHDALLKALAHVAQAKGLIATDPVAAFAQPKPRDSNG